MSEEFWFRIAELIAVVLISIWGCDRLRDRRRRIRGEPTGTKQ